MIVMMLGFNLEYAFSKLAEKKALPESVEVIRAALDCLKDVKGTRITHEMITELVASKNAYTNKQFKQVGKHVAKMAFDYCLKEEIMEVFQ